MELVYLWVEDYKNIHKQGFNFSPRFNCEYDPKTNKLTIDENDDYIENFFGDNINVTAIVGKNGSGKSSVLKIIEECKLDSASLKYILIFRIDNKFYSIEYNMPHVDVVHNDYESRHDMILNILTFSAEMPYPYFEEEKECFNKEVKISLEPNSIVQKVGKYLGQNIKLTTFLYIPKKIEIEQNDIFLENLIESIRPLSVVRSNNPENGLSFEDCHDDRENYHTDNIIEAFMFKDIISNELEGALCNENFFNPKTQGYDVNILEDFYNRADNDLNSENYSIQEFNEIIQKRRFEQDTLLANDLELLKKYHKFLKYDFEDEKGRKYNDLSHGEKTIFGQFINIFDKINISDNLLIFLDEPDISLHPNWQKKYINELSNIFFKMEKSIHFIFTTHSPFLLSDIQKQNIIFLDKDAEGNCIVVDGLKEKKQTFGANIHTLLSDSFFMEDGLMGEFAKGKIEEVIDYLNNKESKIQNNDEAQKLIDIIGEPIIRNQLQKMLDSKRLTKMDEIDTIRTEINDLEKRLKEIEDANDKS